MFKTGKLFLGAVLALGIGAAILTNPQATQAATTVSVGTSGGPKPFTYVDDNNKLVGYDVDTVRAIDKVVPEYKFTFQKMEITSLLTSLDSGRIQVAANNFASNPQRREKYYYSKPVFRDRDVLVVLKDNKSIKKFDDIAGKTTIGTPGVNFTTAVEKFNKVAKNPSKITYSNEDAAKTLQDVQDGKYDYVLIDKVLYDNYQKTYHLDKIKAIELDSKDTKKISASIPYSYLLVEKTPEGKKILTAINKGITKIQSNGTAAKLSQKYFNGNYVPK
ncbi:amino acid ABC transporter substrate-binding protein [Agrilactobacillus composti DSM 18527 = JCM 14202]|uniref:Amino acid ABC transporter substrate-binding protein n=1 Tax=Agrilactobacillus composti DSM 18527 = JCM 14202 TaxID=1423734 RepID=A0A0R1XRY7_9LACO|nr:transporter substrate-binding domain-containing protein [Agrilactobacillus composti]KRM30779.1 amino acid ABC transporter substrate-binding protein [Agrilactobacillus composti DSM 18527 = JCM 14202]